MKERWLKKQDFFPFLFPCLVTVGILLLYPLVSCFTWSFYSYSFARGFRYVGFNNYIDLLHSSTFLISLKNTFIFTLTVVSIEFFLGFIFANLLNQKIKARNLFRTLFLFPMVVSPVVVGITWRFMFNPEFGIINYLLGRLSLPTSLWAAAPSTSLLTCMIADIWEWTPFMILLLLAGLQLIPLENKEAAMIDGASFLQITWYIVIPQIKPMILLVLIIRTMDVIKVFDIVYTLTGGGPGNSSVTTALYAYNTGFREFSLGYASAVSWVLASMILIICFFYIRLLGNKSV